MHFPDGEPRATAARKLCKMLDVEEGFQDGQQYFEARLLTVNKEWLADYRATSRSESSRHGTRFGAPEVPLPYNSRGRLIGRKAMQADGEHYFVSVFEKAKEVPVERGVTIEVYRVADLASSVLHVGPNEIAARLKSDDFLATINQLPPLYSAPDSVLVNKQGVPIEHLEEEVVQTAQPNKTRAVVELLFRDLVIERLDDTQVVAKLASARKPVT